MAVDEIVEAIKSLTPGEVRRLQRRLGWSKVRPQGKSGIYPDNIDPDQVFVEVVQDAFYLTVQYDPKELRRILEGFLQYHRSNRKRSTSLFSDDFKIASSYQVHIPQSKTRERMYDHYLGDEGDNYAAMVVGSSLFQKVTKAIHPIQDAITGPEASGDAPSPKQPSKRTSHTGCTSLYCS